MAVVTLSELMTRTRQRADMVNSLFISDSELTNYINAAKRDFEDMLMNVHGPEYYASSATFAFVAGTENYSLSTITGGTFYQLLGVDVLNTGGIWQTIRSFNFNERNDYPSQLNIQYPFGTGIRYRVIGGDTITFRPTPGAVQTAKLWWVPQQTNMSSTTDSFQAQNGWEDFIVVRAAIMCLTKEESDTTPLQVELQRITERIKSFAPNRDAGEPMRISEVDRADTPFAWRLV